MTADPDPEELADLFLLKSLVEACKLLEEGVSTVREIDLGMMAGAGLDPRRGLFPPFWKADLEGLDTMLEKLERYEECHGERFAPPRILKRLVAQGRLGLKSGQGFYAYPQAEGEGTVKLEKRGEVAIAWLANPPMNAISPAGDRGPRQGLGRGQGRRRAEGDGGLLLAAGRLLRRRRHQGVHLDGRSRERRRADQQRPRAAEGARREPKSTVAAVNAIAYGGGCELAMACDFRVAAQSAVFGQPEINLGIIPGFGGTQRLPRLVGQSKALEMNLTGDAVLAPEARAYGLVDDLVPDEELLDVAISWARKLAGQAPLAMEQIKQRLQQGRSRRGDRGGEAGLREGLPLRGRPRGDLRLPRQARAEVAGEVGTEGAERLAELVRESSCTVALTGAGISVPSGIPDFRTPGTGLWENVDPFEVAHIDAFRRDPARFWSFYRPRLASLDGVEPNPAHSALAELERRGLLRR